MTTTIQTDLIYFYNYLFKCKVGGRICPVSYDNEIIILSWSGSPKGRGRHGSREFVVIFFENITVKMVGSKISTKEHDINALN